MRLLQLAWQQALSVTSISQSVERGKRVASMDPTSTGSVTKVTLEFTAEPRCTLEAV